MLWWSLQSLPEAALSPQWFPPHIPTLPEALQVTLPCSTSGWGPCKFNEKKKKNQIKAGGFCDHEMDTVAAASPPVAAESQPLTYL